MDCLAPICEFEIETSADYTVGLSNPEKFSKAWSIRSIEIKANLGMSERFAAAMIQLKDDLVSRCHLDGSDLPHSPQERMAEP